MFLLSYCNNKLHPIASKYKYLQYFATFQYGNPYNFSHGNNNGGPFTATFQTNVYTGDVNVGISMAPDLIQRIKRGIENKIPWFTIKKGFDFVIDIPSVLGIANGWTISVPDRSLEILLEDSNKNAATIGVLGYYSKGKSFIVEGICNAGGGANISLPQSAGVATKGISGVYSAYDNEGISKARLLILDTAGRNAPALARRVLMDKDGKNISYRKKLNNSHDSMNGSKICYSNNNNNNSSNNDGLQSLRDEISAMRSKERYIDDIIILTSDTIVYVMDEVLNEDQRTLCHIINLLGSTDLSFNKKKLIVVHNYKRLEPGSDDAYKMYREQIEDAFNAELRDNGNGLQLYESNWAPDNDNVNIKHIALFNANSREGKAHNDRMFAYLSNTAKTARPTDAKNVHRLNAIAGAAAQYLSRYVSVEASPGTTHDAVILNPHNDRQQEDPLVRGKIQLCPSVSNKKLVLAPWELREMPRPLSTGKFEPNSNHFEVYDADGRKMESVIRVDLPGMDESDRAQGGTKPKGSWFKTKRKVSHNGIQCTVEGYREAAHPKESDGKVFGEFKLTFVVDNYFSAGNFSMKFENGCLVWTGKLEEDGTTDV